MRSIKITLCPGLKRCSDCYSVASYVVETRNGKFYACNNCIENWTDDEDEDGVEEE